MRSLVRYVLLAAITAVMFDIATHANAIDFADPPAEYQLGDSGVMGAATPVDAKCPTQRHVQKRTPGHNEIGNGREYTDGQPDMLMPETALSAIFISQYLPSLSNSVINGPGLGSDSLGDEWLCSESPPLKTAAAAPALLLNAAVALVMDQRQWQPLYAREPAAIRPIASITKLMTAMIVLDAKLPPYEVIQILDVDKLKGSNSRLLEGTRLTRAELLRLALMASENRAAAALARAYPGGARAFVAAMNRKAHELGMRDSHFVDPTGLNPANVSTALDLAAMVNAAYEYGVIREATTTRKHRIALSRGRRTRMLTFHNSNRLVSSAEWNIGLSKTGYIHQAGRCLVMQAILGSKPVIIVLLDSMKKTTRLADANYIRHWLSSELSAGLRPADRAGEAE